VSEKKNWTMSKDGLPQTKKHPVVFLQKAPRKKGRAIKLPLRPTHELGRKKVAKAQKWGFSLEDGITRKWKNLAGVVRQASTPGLGTSNGSSFKKAKKRSKTTLINSDADAQSF